MLLGYRPYTSDTIAFRSGRPIDMGTVSLVPEENRLEGIAVTGSRGRIVYKLDRQRISGSASLSAAGGTAADILGSTPSVRVDADGEVSFRGSTGFLVYVDGKPAVQEGTRAMEQIPASTVADIEIITTPSARYKTDGDAGIINIVTKRQTGEGLSGAVGMAGSTLRGRERRRAAGVPQRTSPMVRGRNRGRNPREKRFRPAENHDRGRLHDDVRRRRNPS